MIKMNVLMIIAPKTADVITSLWTVTTVIIAPLIVVTVKSVVLMMMFIVTITMPVQLIAVIQTRVVNIN
jgi:hypothetical protein